MSATSEKHASAAISAMLTDFVYRHKVAQREKASDQQTYVMPLGLTYSSIFGQLGTRIYVNLSSPSSATISSPVGGRGK